MAQSLDSKVAPPAYASVAAIEDGQDPAAAAAAVAVAGPTLTAPTESAKKLAQSTSSTPTPTLGPPILMPAGVDRVPDPKKGP